MVGKFFSLFYMRACLRTDGKHTILAVNNLSRFSQAVELNLGDYKGAVPREMFGDNLFPAIGKLPSVLTFGPHSFFWLNLVGSPAKVKAIAKKERKG
jgi:maltose alpha-D-glucosyltransferase/alpha-amylase